MTLESVAGFTGAGRIGVSNSDRILAETQELPFDADGWVRLEPGVYAVRLNETVALPRNVMALAKPRSTLLRNGAAAHNAVWDAGYNGRSQIQVAVYNPHGLTLARNARIVQMVFFHARRRDRDAVRRHLPGRGDHARGGTPMTTSQTPDVVVVGGGVMGCATAYFLATEHGIRSVIVERDAVASGASGGAAGELGAVGRHRYSIEYTRFLLEGIRMHTEIAETLVAESGVDYLFTDIPILRPALEETRGPQPAGADGLAARDRHRRRVARRDRGTLARLVADAGRARRGVHRREAAGGVPIRHRARAGVREVAVWRYAPPR